MSSVSHSFPLLLSHTHSTLTKACFVPTLEPTPKALKTAELKKAAAGAFAAFTLATSALNVPAAGASDFAFPSSTVVAETVTRQGVYKEYDVEVGEQTYDDARSTFKDAKETKSKKGEFMPS